MLDEFKRRNLKDGDKIALNSHLLTLRFNKTSKKWEAVFEDASKLSFLGAVDSLEAVIIPIEWDNGTPFIMECRFQEVSEDEDEEDVV